MLTILPRPFSSLRNGSKARRANTRAALPELMLAAKLAFIPWNGCAVPGSPYSTGVVGIPGKDCQKVYTPAAEAERRAVERLQAKAAPTLTSVAPSETNQQAQAAVPSGVAQQQQQQQDEAGSPPSSPAASVASLRLRPGWVDKEAIREALAADLRGRNQELVDAAWQSLE